MIRAEELGALSPKQHVSRKPKSEDIQDLNTRLFYNIKILKRVPGTNTFADLVSNYDLVVHSIV